MEFKGGEGNNAKITGFEGEGGGGGHLNLKVKWGGGESSLTKELLKAGTEYCVILVK